MVKTMSDAVKWVVTRVVKETDVRVKEADVRVEVGVECNPVKVLNDEGKVVGTATVSFEGGIKLHFYLDPNNPEVFDLDVDPKRIRVLFQGGIYDNKLHGGVVFLESR